ncbi:MAG: nitronate monooxygenase [Pseudomonadota bacterium]
MSLPFNFGARLKIPLIVAPMFLVSNPKMAIASCRAGVIGSYPAHCTRTREVFAQWLRETEQALQVAEDAGEEPAPFAVNLVVHPSNARYEGDLELVEKHKVPIVLTSKGAPTDVFDRIHDYGGVAFHDVASARHAEKAVAAGADALIAVAGGAGGHCGTLNPFALVSEIKAITDKPIILAGGLTSGTDILAAQAMGASMVYMGTRFIATHESNAPDDYRQSMIEGSATDIFLSAALDGAPANWYAPSLVKAGIDLEELAVTKPGAVMTSDGQSKQRYNGIWSAGHGIGATKDVLPVGQLCADLIQEYTTARDKLSKLLAAVD